MNTEWKCAQGQKTGKQKYRYTQTNNEKVDNSVVSTKGNGNTKNRLDKKDRPKREANRNYKHAGV